MIIDLQFGNDLDHLYLHLRQRGYIHNLDIDQSLLGIHSHEVLKQIREGQEGWQDMVPDVVVNMILERGLFDSALRLA